MVYINYNNCINFFWTIVLWIFLNKGESTFGNVSSYYLPIFSFGNSEFPPLEF